ncbi:MAG TPA: MFS transporter [Limnochordales bacterium]
MGRRRVGRWPLVLPAAAEGVATAVALGYGPLYMRQALGEPRLAVTTLMLALSALTWFVAAAVWGRLGDRVSRPLALVGGTLLVCGVVQAALAVVGGSAAFIAVVVVCSYLLAAIAPLSVSWLTLADPEHPAEESAGFYRMRSVGWTIGSIGTSLLVNLLDLSGITAAFLISSGVSVAVALAVLTAARGLEAPRREAVLDTANPAPANPPRGSATAPAVSANAPIGPFGAPEMSANPSGQGRRVAIWRFHAVGTLVAVVLLTTTGNEAFFAVVGPYLTEYLSGPPEYVGISIGVASFLGIVIMGPLGRVADRWGAERVLVAGCLIYAAMYALIAAWRDPLATVVLFGSPVFPFMSLGATGTLSRRTPAARRSEAVGVYEGTAALAAAIGSLLGGVVADAAGLGWVPVMAWMLAMGGLLVAWGRLRPGSAPARGDRSGAPIH